MKKTISLLLCVLMLLSFVPSVTAEDDITVLVNGKEVLFDAQPFIEDGRVLVPVRFVSESLGKTVSWRTDAGGDNQEAVIEDDEYIYQIGIGSYHIIISGKHYKDGLKYIPMDCAARIVQDRTFIPLRAVSETFGYEVDWNDGTRTVRITSTEETSGNYVQALMNQMPENENYVISPLSLKIAMLMAANGAEGTTQNEILETFGQSSISQADRDISDLMASLNNRENGEIHLANSIWFNKGYYSFIENADFSESYKEIIETVFGGTAQSVQMTDSIEAVNEWVNTNTKGKIPTLLTEDHRKYLAVLVNAVYMKSAWVSPFEDYATAKDRFTDFSGKESQIDFMHQTAHFMYYEKDGTRALRLPYENGLSMYVVLDLPDKVDLASIHENSEWKKIRLSLPKFKTEYALTLRELLEQMGIHKAFLNDNHDFDSMMTNLPDPLKIDDVLQKAIIEVDEKGTEAAAATAIIIKAGSTAITEPEPIIEFKADHPFTYYIVDDATSEVLFAGRFVSPEN